MKGIHVDGLTKHFRAKQKAPGLLGSVKSFVKPQYNHVKAVDNISFSIKEGELVALIGPNGAGKSTTLKMLTGILHSDKGTLRVNGLNPAKERKKLAFQVGTVFGQKPQLWYHLPAIDTFDLFSRIYELDQKEYHKRLKELVSYFQLEEFLHTSVRKLSLGQRMRAEIVASLLHKPRILFLDEPSIGLDITTKKRIRSFIKDINKKEKLSIILTSHDMQDIDKICKRIFIINHGKIVYEGSIKDMRQNYLNRKIISVLCDHAVSSVKLKHTRILKKAKFSFKLELDTSKRTIKSLLQDLTEKFSIIDLNIANPPIEDIIEDIYGTN
ncbi:MAG: ATP-binding cassette domain-containing protein [Candidatus Woesearchaeota archaeon]